MTGIIQVYTTTEKRDDAEKISRELTQKRLVSCAQITGPIKSVYWWKDKLEETEEWLLIMKTPDELYPDLETEIKRLHPYEVPEIIAVPVIKGSADYLNWVKRETLR
jgi:periplasmic divalent cation tolerance protein